MRQLAVFLLVLIVCSSSCKKDEEPVVPEIELISVTPLDVVEFRDSIIIMIHYKDEDGDLGFFHPDTLSLRVQDSRLANPDYYHIPPLSPPGQGLTIDGQLRIKINNLFLLGNGSQEFTTLSLKLRDREGNWSNEVTSGQITINKKL